MASNTPPGDDFLPVADVEVTAVESLRSGFRLTGKGQDAADYRLELHLDVPVDPRTRTVLGELLAQTEWRLWRRSTRPLNPNQDRRLGRDRTRAER